MKKFTNSKKQKSAPQRKGSKDTSIALPSKSRPTNSNWEKVKAGISNPTKNHKHKAKQSALSAGYKARLPKSVNSNHQLTRIVALDCEMVGVGESGMKSALARVCVVNYYGNVMLDTYSKPKEKVVDYRTHVSGVKAIHLKDAPPFATVQRKVSTLLKGKILVGHALKNDLKALKLKHPKCDIRDTSSFHLLRHQSVGHSTKRSKALKELAAQHLGIEIQHGQHSPVDDARAALYLYQKFKVQWERSLNTQKGKGKKDEDSKKEEERKEEKKQEDKKKMLITKMSQGQNSDEDSEEDYGTNLFVNE